MKTVHITVDDALTEEVDRTAERLGTTRSGSTPDALRIALADAERRELERQHREGYHQHPVDPDEVDVWKDEQVWID